MKQAEHTIREVGGQAGRRTGRQAGRRAGGQDEPVGRWADERAG